MKTYLKQILSGAIIALTFTLFTAPVQADVGTADFGITNSIAAANTNATAAQVGTSVNIDNVDNVGVVFKANGSAAGTSNVKISFMLSADNSTWCTNSTFDWYVALGGSAQPMIYYTNIPTAVLGSAGYIAVYQLGNANTSANATNASLTLVKKKLR